MVQCTIFSLSLSFVLELGCLKGIVQCVVVLCSATPYSVLQCSAVLCCAVWCSTLYSIVPYCTALQIGMLVEGLVLLS